MADAPRFVTLTGGRNRFQSDYRYGQTIDAAIYLAYVENVGHEPHNLDVRDPGFDQWHYNPRRPLYRGRADELARV
jgi:hypothetical protein